MWVYFWWHFVLHLCGVYLAWVFVRFFLVLWIRGREISPACGILHRLSDTEQRYRTGRLHSWQKMVWMVWRVKWMPACSIHLGILWSHFATSRLVTCFRLRWTGRCVSWRDWPVQRLVPDITAYLCSSQWEGSLQVSGCLDAFYFSLYFLFIVGMKLWGRDMKTCQNPWLLSAIFPWMSGHNGLSGCPDLFPECAQATVFMFRT